MGHSKGQVAAMRHLSNFQLAVPVTGRTWIVAVRPDLSDRVIWALSDVPSGWN